MYAALLLLSVLPLSFADVAPQFDMCTAEMQELEYSGNRECCDSSENAPVSLTGLTDLNGYQFRPCDEGQTSGYNRVCQEENVTGVSNELGEVNFTLEVWCSEGDYVGFNSGSGTANQEETTKEKDDMGCGMVRTEKKWPLLIFVFLFFYAQRQWYEERT